MFKFLLGGIICGIKCSDKNYLAYIHELFKDFESDKNYDFAINFKVIDGDGFNKKRHIIKKDGSYIEIMDVKKQRNTIYFNHSKLKGNFDLDKLKGSVTLFRIRDCVVHSEKIVILRDFIRTIFAFLLLRKGKLLVHSAGVFKKRKAFLFVGKATEGKSTIAKFCIEKGYNLLSDECVLIYKDKGRTIAAGTPLGPRWKLNNSATKLEKIFLIKKSRRLNTKELRKCEGIAKIQHNIFPNTLLDLKRFREHFAGVFLVSLDLLSDIPFYELNNEKNDKFLRFLE